MLRINIQNEGATAILHCSGRVVFGLEVETLRSIAKSRAERHLLVDLKNIETMDACGLGLLVELQHWAAEEHHSLTFVNASEFVLRLILLTGLQRVLAVPTRDIRNYCPSDRTAASIALSA
jgi:anti-anti-sigma factor